MGSGCLPVTSLHCSLSCAHSGWATVISEGEWTGLARQAFPPSHARTHAWRGEAFWPSESPKFGQGTQLSSPCWDTQMQVYHVRQFTCDGCEGTENGARAPGCLAMARDPGPSSSPALTTSWQHPGLPQPPPARWFSNSPSPNLHEPREAHGITPPPLQMLRVWFRAPCTWDIIPFPASLSCSKLLFTL